MPNLFKKNNVQCPRPLHYYVWGDYGRVPRFCLTLENVAEALPLMCFDGLKRRCLVGRADAVEMLRPDVLRVIVVGKSGTLMKTRKK